MTTVMYVMAIMGGIVVYLMIGVLAAAITYVVDKKEIYTSKKNSVVPVFIGMWPIMMLVGIISLIFVNLEKLAIAMGKRMAGERDADE
jgi:hypothetical protein